MSIDDFNIDDIIEQIKIENVVKSRRDKFERNGRPFREAICYRKGTIGSWREELSDEVKRMYLAKYPHLNE